MESNYPKIKEEVAKYGAVQNIMHLVNGENLMRQHREQARKKVPGIDEVTKEIYGAKLNANVGELVERLKSFSYRPQPVKRVYIPKVGSDKLRPLGIPAYEDRLVQGAMAEILTAIYEPKFLSLSYGFRPNRSCHDAIKALNNNIMGQKTNWVVDADIKGFFDNVDHEWLIKFLDHDIKDKNFMRYIKRFLMSGIMDKGQFTESDKGTPQGGLISPILANVYLHYVLDLWFDKIRKSYNGYASITRYADDFVCCFQYEREAKDFLARLKERLQKFGLEIAENKSKIVGFGQFARRNGHKETFDFLGFTHINGMTWQGKYKVIHHTSNKKLKSKRQAIKEWLKNNMHTDKGELVKALNVKLVGHYRYYGITDNQRAQEGFRQYALKRLFKTLRRRSQKKRINWDWFNKFLQYNPIAKPKVYVSLLS